MLRRALAASLALLALASPAAIAHQGNPNFRSEVTGSSPGVDAEVLSLDDRIEIRAEPGHEVVVLGYEDEPYLRFLADGTVQVNQRSPATYLNEDRFAEVELPAQADAEAPPEWSDVAAHDTYDWHDHRIHYMGEGTPPQVERRVGGDARSSTGRCRCWSTASRRRSPERSPGCRPKAAPSIALLAGLAAAVLGSFGFFIWRIRRRGRTAGSAKATATGRSGEARPRDPRGASARGARRARGRIRSCRARADQPRRRDLARDVARAGLVSLRRTGRGELRRRPRLRPRGQSDRLRRADPRAAGDGRGRPATEASRRRLHRHLPCRQRRLASGLGRVHVQRRRSGRSSRARGRRARRRGRRRTGHRRGARRRPGGDLRVDCARDRRGDLPLLRLVAGARRFCRRARPSPRRAPASIPDCGDC